MYIPLIEIPGYSNENTPEERFPNDTGKPEGE
jgi:hypothetical protein